MRVALSGWPLAAAVAVVTVASCSGGDTAPQARSRTSPTTSGAEPWVLSRIELGTKPCGIQAAGDRVWVSNYGDGTLQWIDVATGRVGPPIRVGSEPCGVAVGGGSVWVENYGSNDVTRVDEVSGRVMATIDVGAAPYDVAYSHGAAWVTDYTDGTVSRIDAATNRRTVVNVGGQPVGIAPVAGALWVGRQDNGTVVRIDARAARVTDRLRAGEGAGWTSYDEDDVWVSNGRAGTVTRIAARTRVVGPTVAVGGQPLDGTVIDGLVYVPTKEGTIFRIDPATDTVTSEFASTVGNPFVVTGAHGMLWAVDYTGTEAVRIDLSKVPDAPP